jgi:hypothetical protein
MRHYPELSNLQIDQYYKSCSAYGGCFSKDQLPKQFENKFYIINMQNSTDGGGTHWTLMYSHNIPTCLYVDSFGIVPPLEALTFMRTSHKPMYFSTKDCQNLTSSLCGYYTIYFCDQMLNGRTLLDICKQDLNFDTIKDDNVIRQIFSKVKFKST